MATWFEITYTGVPTEADYARAAELVAEGYLSGQLINDPEPDECDDSACREQGCPEHPACNGGDHTYEQHHTPKDHVGDGPCRCDVYT